MDLSRAPAAAQKEDTDALSRARAGDRASLGQLLTGYRNFLLSVAHRELDVELRGKLGPSDIVQETFLQAQEAFAAFQGSTGAELQAWLQQTLVHRCRDLRDAYVRSKKRQVSREVAFDAGSGAQELLQSLSSDTATPSEHAIEDEVAARVTAAVARLPLDYREVVWLRNWESLSYEEIGQRTGRSADAARKVFSRAVQRLGDELGPDHGASAAEQRGE